MVPGAFRGSATKYILHSNKVIAIVNLPRYCMVMFDGTFFNGTANIVLKKLFALHVNYTAVLVLYSLEPMEMSRLDITVDRLVPCVCKVNNVITALIPTARCSQAVLFAEAIDSFLTSAIQLMCATPG